MTGTKMMRDWR